MRTLIAALFISFLDAYLVSRLDGSYRLLGGLQFLAGLFVIPLAANRKNWPLCLLGIWAWVSPLLARGLEIRAAGSLAERIGPAQIVTDGQKLILEGSGYYPVADSRVASSLLGLSPTYAEVRGKTLILRKFTLIGQDDISEDFSGYVVTTDDKPPSKTGEDQRPPVRLAPNLWWFQD